MDYDCIEIERRLAIGFNEYLSPAQRTDLILQGRTLGDIAGKDTRFRLYTRETRDILHWLSKSRDNSIIWYGDADFPSFRPLASHIPYMILCQGSHPQLFRDCVAIVGTRHATYNALHQAFRFGYEATENSMAVISGFAEGIDQSGMQGAISGNGPCIGVLACGHDVEYPCLTMGMRERVLDAGGCVLSRFAPSEPSFKSNFLARNMIIAAYASFTVAVQAPAKSGTLNTCDYTVQMGKEIFIGSEGVGDRFVQGGTTALFNDGARVIAQLSESSFSGKLRFRVLECLENEGNVDSQARFGDRMYMVREAIS